MPQVLVIEDDQDVREAVGRLLVASGHDVRLCGTALDGLHELAAWPPDVVVLDLGLPDLDGTAVLRRIRAGSQVPVLVATAREQESEMIRLLRAGADDYVVKPYGFRELLARMDAVMRRATPRRQSDHVVEHGPLRIDTLTREVQLHNQVIPMSRKEFDLLHLLAVNPHSVVSREQIMRQVWENSWSRRTVDTHVSSIRQKLGGKSWILTVRGVGFRIGRNMAMIS